MEMKVEIRNALIKIDFVRRYEAISISSRDRVQPENREKVDNDKVFSIIQRLGYNATFDKKERFFKVFFCESGHTEFWINIVLRSKAAEFVWEYIIMASCS